MGFMDLMKNPAVQAAITAPLGASTGGVGPMLAKVALQMALHLGADAFQGKRLSGRRIFNTGLNAVLDNLPTQKNPLTTLLTQTAGKPAIGSMIPKKSTHPWTGTYPLSSTP